MKATDYMKFLSESIIMMVYAEPKVGKSHFAATALETDRCLVITDRNGIETYFGAQLKKQFPELNYDNLEIELVDRDSSWTNVQAFLRINEILREYFEKKLDTFDVVIIDDASFARNAARNLAIKANGMAGRSSTLASAQREDKKSFNATSILEESDFGREMEMVANFFDELTSVCRKNNKHLIVCAHEAQIYIKKKNDKGKDVPTLDKITAAFTGKKEPTATSRYFSIVARITRKGKEAAQEIIFQCKSDGLVDAGDRYGVLQMYEKNLTWAILKKKVASHVAAIEPQKEKKIEPLTQPEQ